MIIIYSIFKDHSFIIVRSPSFPLLIPHDFVHFLYKLLQVRIDEVPLLTLFSQLLQSHCKRAYLPVSGKLCDQLPTKLLVRMGLYELFTFLQPSMVTSCDSLLLLLEVVSKDVEFLWKVIVLFLKWWQLWLHLGFEALVLRAILFATEQISTHYLIQL